MKTPDGGERVVKKYVKIEEHELRDLNAAEAAQKKRLMPQNDDISPSQVIESDDSCERESICICRLISVTLLYTLIHIVHNRSHLHTRQIHAQIRGSSDHG